MRVNRGDDVEQAGNDNELGAVIGDGGLHGLRAEAEGAAEEIEQAAAQIASQLFLSTKTVQNHTSSIYRKLGVRSRSEAVVKAMELHFISSGT